MSQRALSGILTTINRDRNMLNPVGHNASTLRRSMRESRNEALASLWTELALPGADGIVVKFNILSPQRLLQTAAQQSPAFRILLQNALQQFPSIN